MKVLITSVSAGTGHVKAAQAVHAAFKSAYPDVETAHIDLMDYVSPLFKNIYVNKYIALVHYAPRLWKILYHMTANPGAGSFFQSCLGPLQRLFVKPFLDYIQEFKPDAILTTHFLIPQVLPAHMSVGKKSVLVGCVVTDYEYHHFWINEGAHHYFLATETLAHEYVRRGHSSLNLTVSGIPISPVFSGDVSASSIRRAYNLEDNRPVLLVLSGGFGIGPLEDIVRRAFSLEPSLHIITVAGTNQRLRRELDEMVPPSHVSLLNLGLVDNMHELLSVCDLVVTKAGGMTVSECLAKGAAMLFFGSIPGQEESNAAFVESLGAGYRAKDLAHLEKLMSQLLTNPGILNEVKHHAAAHAKPRAAFTIAEKMVQLLRKS